MDDFASIDALAEAIVDRLGLAYLTEGHRAVMVSQVVAWLAQGNDDGSPACDLAERLIDEIDVTDWHRNALLGIG